MIKTVSTFSLTWLILVVLFILSYPTLRYTQVYRPYDVGRFSTYALGKGATGIAEAQSVNEVPLNPAHLASIEKKSIGFALGSQLRITRLRTNFSFQPQSIAFVGGAINFDENSSFAISLHPSFQRIFPDSSFTAYIWEIAYGRSIWRYLDVGISLGATMLAGELLFH